MYLTARDLEVIDYALNLLQCKLEDKLSVKNESSETRKKFHIEVIDIRTKVIGELHKQGISTDE